MYHGGRELMHAMFASLFCVTVCGKTLWPRKHADPVFQATPTRRCRKSHQTIVT